MAPRSWTHPLTKTLDVVSFNLSHVCVRIVLFRGKKEFYFSIHETVQSIILKPDSLATILQ